MSWLGDFAGGIAGNIVDSAFGRSNAKYAAGLSYGNWVKQMSNAHQLEVADLRKAGLNPILSATNSQMAGIGSAPSITTGNTADNLTNASIARMQNNTALKGLEIEDKKAETERLNAATNLKNAETQERLATSQGFVNNALIGYYDASSAFQYSRRDKVIQDIVNSKLITKATVDNLYSGTALNYKQVDLLTQNIKESVERSNLLYWQKSSIIADLSSVNRSLKQADAQQQLDYITTGIGPFLHQIGIGARDLNPFSGFGFNDKGNTGFRF